MLMTDDLLRGLEADFAFVAQGEAPEEVERRLRLKVTGGREQYDGTLLPYIFAGYVLGRDQEGSPMGAVCQYVLGVLDPEAERRLPWYDVMFDILNEGAFREIPSTRGSGRRIFYELSRSKEREFADRLEHERPTISGGRTVQKLCSWLADIPGTTLEATRSAYAETGLGRIAMISSYLHRPLAEILRKQNVITLESAADFHYRALHEEAH